jgi:hypothetical protein
MLRSASGEMMLSVSALHELREVRGLAEGAHRDREHVGGLAGQVGAERVGGLGVAARAQELPGPAQRARGRGRGRWRRRLWAGRGSRGLRGGRSGRRRSCGCRSGGCRSRDRRRRLRGRRRGSGRLCRWRHGRRWQGRGPLLRSAEAEAHPGDDPKLLRRRLGKDIAEVDAGPQREPLVHLDRDAGAGLDGKVRRRLAHSARAHRGPSHPGEAFDVRCDPLASKRVAGAARNA